MPEWYADHYGSRICTYCNRRWTMAHNCVQRRIIQYQSLHLGISLEEQLAEQVRVEEARRERRHDRSRRRRQLHEAQETINNQMQIIQYLKESLERISRHYNISGDHCGCYYSLRAMALEALARMERGDARPN